MMQFILSSAISALTVTRVLGLDQGRKTIHQLLPNAYYFVNLKKRPPPFNPYVKIHFFARCVLIFLNQHRLFLCYLYF